MDRCPDQFQQFFPPERLRKKAGCALPDRPFAIRAISLRAHEDDWHTIVGAGQFALKFQAVNAGQLYVNDQANRFPRTFRRQKLFC